MNSPVSLKGVGDGLCLYINKALSQEEIILEITPLFERINKLAAGARILVESFDKSEETLIFLRNFLKEKYKVAEVIAAKDAQENQEARKRQRETQSSWKNRNSDVLMMCGRIRSGQKIHHQGHIVLMGDLNPGGEIRAGGDVIVLGSLYGSVIAGLKGGEEEAIVMALDFRPTLVHIAQYISTGPYNNLKGPHYAFIKEGEIKILSYLEDPPFTKLPWPKPR